MSHIASGARAQLHVAIMTDEIQDGTPREIEPSDIMCAKRAIRTALEAPDVDDRLDIIDRHEIIVTATCAARAETDGVLYE